MIITDTYGRHIMPKDLDQSDVENDARTMMQKEFEEWGEHIDPADLLTILDIITAHTGDSIHTLLESAMGRDIITATQSNPEKATYALTQMLDLQDAMNS